VSKKSAKVRGRSPSKASENAGEAALKQDSALAPIGGAAPKGPATSGSAAPLPSAPSPAVPAPAAPSPAAAKSPPTAPIPASAPTQEEIGRLARDLWQQRGRPQGQDLDIWCEAERRLTRKK